MARPRRLRVLEAKIMLRDLFLGVEGCINACLTHVLKYGKSPCFSGMRVLRPFSVDGAVLDLLRVHGVGFLECAV